MQQMQVHMKISALEQLNDVTDRLQQQLSQMQITKEKQMDLRLCLMEAVQNSLLTGRGLFFPLRIMAQAFPRRCAAAAGMFFLWKNMGGGFC